MLKIRYATQEDLSALQVLYDAQVEYMAALQPMQYKPAKADPSFIKREISYPHGGVLVAADDNDTIWGFISFYLTENKNNSFRVPHRFCELENLYVLPQKRKCGIGTLLFNSAIHYAEENKVNSIQFMTLAENKRMQRLAEKSGFRYMEHVYIRESLL